MRLSSFNTIAERLRAARLATNHTQQQLAGDDFSKSYISAIERGKMIPSLQALGLLAERLGVSASYLLGEEEIDLQTLAEGPVKRRFRFPDEQRTREEQACFALSEAEGWLRLHHPHEALRLLPITDGPSTSLPTLARLRWYLLAGQALFLLQRTSEAATLFSSGLSLAEQLQQTSLPDKHSTLTEYVALFHWALGTCYIACDKLYLALECFQQGYAAMHATGFKNPELEFRLALAIGQVYLTLGRPEDALSIYEATNQTLQESESLQSQIHSTWEHAEELKANGQLHLAHRFLEQVLAGWAMLDQQHQAAEIHAQIGEALLHIQQYTEAEQALLQSLMRARHVNDARTQGIALNALAKLYLAQDALSLASTTAEEGLQVIKESGDHPTKGYLLLTLATAHEKQNQPEAAEQAYLDAIGCLNQPANETELRMAHARYAQFLERQQRFEEAFQQMRLSIHPIRS